MGKTDETDVFVVKHRMIHVPEVRLSRVTEQAAGCGDFAGRLIVDLASLGRAERRSRNSLREAESRCLRWRRPATLTRYAGGVARYPEPAL